MNTETQEQKIPIPLHCAGSQSVINGSSKQAWFSKKVTPETKFRNLKRLNERRC